MMPFRSIFVDDVHISSPVDAIDLFCSSVFIRKPPHAGHMWPLRTAEIRNLSIKGLQKASSYGDAGKYASDMRAGIIVWPLDTSAPGIRNAK